MLKLSYNVSNFERKPQLNESLSMMIGMASWTPTRQSLFKGKGQEPNMDVGRRWLQLASIGSSLTAAMIELGSKSICKMSSALVHWRARQRRNNIPPTSNKAAMAPISPPLFAMVASRVSAADRKFANEVGVEDGI